MNGQTFLCIDMKSFYASVECAKRHLNPLETNLVVADVSRGKNALCLAVSPSLKALGVHNRCRLSEIPATVPYIIAPPRMQLYINTAADIYALYLKHFSPADIHVYSIDECFIDVSGYLTVLKTDGLSLAKQLMGEIAENLHIPSTAGVGTNLYLAKIALDITAKKCKDHIGFLDEESYRRTLWDHRPLTDFWMIAEGKARQLARQGMTTMGDIAHAPEELLYRLFGKDAELLIDHAWGRETCRMEDIKNYRPQSKSVSFSQILPRDYTPAEARTVLQEMVLQGSYELLKRRVIAPKIGVMAGFSGNLFPVAKGEVRLPVCTAVYSRLVPYALQLFDGFAPYPAKIRRLGLSFNEVCADTCEGYDFFTDWEAVEREKEREKTVISLQKRFGKNAVLRGTNLLEEATQRERNTMIGGHRAGYDESQ